MPTLAPSTKKVPNADEPANAAAQENGDETNKLNSRASKSTLIKVADEPEKSTSRSSKVVKFEVSMKNIDYDQLVASKALVSQTKASIRAAVAKEAGRGVKEDHVNVELSRGSVKASVIIKSPSGAEAYALASTMKNSVTLAKSVASAVASVPGIADAITGTVKAVVSYSPEVSTVPLTDDTDAPAVFRLDQGQPATNEDDVERIRVSFGIKGLQLQKFTPEHWVPFCNSVKKHFGVVVGIADREQIGIASDGQKITLRFQVPKGSNTDELLIQLSGDRGREIVQRIVQDINNKQELPQLQLLKKGLLVAQSPWATALKDGDDEAPPDEESMSPAFKKAYLERADVRAAQIVSHFKGSVQNKLETAWYVLDADDSGLCEKDEVDAFFEEFPSYQRAFEASGIPDPFNKAHFMNFWKSISIFLGLNEVLLEEELENILKSFGSSVKEALERNDDQFEKDFQEELQQKQKIMEEQVEALVNAANRASECMKSWATDLDKRSKMVLNRRREASRRKEDRLLNEYVRINVGGDSSFVYKRAVLLYENTYLAELFDAIWRKALVKDREGVIFLDADPVQMRALLDWLSESKRFDEDFEKGADSELRPKPQHPIDRLSEVKRWGFQQLADHWNFTRIILGENTSMSELHVGDDPGQEDVHFESTVIFTSEHYDWLIDSMKVDGMLPERTRGSEVIVENWPVKPKIDLLHRASRDGFSSRAFHQHCDHQGPTLIVATDGNDFIFGGFSDVSWCGSGRLVSAPQAFVFELSGPGLTEPVKRHLSALPSDRAAGIYDHQHSGPQFGLAPMLLIHGSETSRTSATMKNPVADPTGLTVSGKISVQGTLGDVYNVGVHDYEVYRVTWERSHIEELDKVGEVIPGHCKEALQAFVEAAEIEERLRLMLDREEAVVETMEEAWRKGLAPTPFVKKYLLTMQVPDPIVYLSVRGVHMATSSATLSVVQMSPLAQKIEKLRLKPVDSHELVEGCVYVDEDPECFERMLNYLRLCRMGFSPKLPPAPLGMNDIWEQLALDFGLGGMLASDRR